MNIAVCGGGSWGTAIARLLSNNDINVKFYIRETKTVEDIRNNRENTLYLPGCKFKRDIFVSTNLEKCIKDIDIFVIGVPTSSVKDVLTRIKDKLEKKVILVNLSKGIDTNSLKRVSEIAKDILPENPFVSLSGPSHAEEVGKDIPTTVVAASENIKYAEIVQDLFTTENFRIYSNEDLIGVEFGGALKNIIALAAGISDGLNYGDNTKAALMTRGIYEMSKLGVKLGANPHTFNGLSGIGDLIVTCTSMHSRNRRAGILIGKGKDPKEACREVGQVVEGILTTKSAYELAKKYNVDMPITSKLYEIIYEHHDPSEAVKILMNREKKQEIEQNFFE